MSGSFGLKKRKKSHIVEETEKIVDQRMAENSIDDLQRLSVIWSSMLNLVEPMLPSQAAAMLAVSDLIRATTLVDSKEHWVNAAAHAMLGAHSDEGSTEDLEQEQLTPQAQDEKIPISVGFVGSLGNQR